MKIKEIRIYIEGGGNGKDGKALLRRGFNDFLVALRKMARSRRIRWSVITCGSRNNTYDAFKTALKVHQKAFNILLVDSEGPVKSGPWEHLRLSDNWAPPVRANDHCHLMVQTMEAWLIADMDSLRSFYGRGFNLKAIPGNTEIENIPKKSLESALRKATRITKKGEYHKIQHAGRLLSLINVQAVRRKAPHCERLFQTVTHIIEHCQ